MSNPARAADPYGAFLFTIEVSPADVPGSSGNVGGCAEVSGLNIETEVETMRAGGVNHHDVTLPGPTKFPSRLVLKRGLAERSFFWAWYLAVMGGKVARRDVKISMLDERHTPVYTWTFMKACPVKWTGPDLRASNSAVAFESIDLIHRGLQLR